jgi:biofilm PGA synthesis N-glycosyltransferase PgaC
MRRLIVAVIPAYQEEDLIGATIASLHAQTRRPDHIVVVPNNCTDRTADVAREAGAYVLEMPGPNPDKKAGAINYALDKLGPYLDGYPYNVAVLVMDGDTALSPDFVRVAERHLTAGIGGVGGTFAGRECSTHLGYMQRMEYHRYGKTSERFGHQAFVLTGTGTLFSYLALKDVKAQRRRGVLLPPGDSFYDTHSLTEDNELTFALQACGYSTISPSGMYATTDVMETYKSIVAQRERWYLGALRNIWQYGGKMPFHMRWTYWRQQVGLFVSSIVAGLYLLMVGLSLSLTGDIQWSWWWTLPSVLLLVERVWSIWSMGWRARIYAALFVPEQVYTLLLTFIYSKAFLKFVRGDRGSWIAT